jgi:hypothetical protein
MTITIEDFFTPSGHYFSLYKLVSIREEILVQKQAYVWYIRTFQEVSNLVAPMIGNRNKEHNAERKTKMVEWKECI